MANEPSEAVQAVLRATIVPERRAVPRLAEPLTSVDPHFVASPQGAVAAWRLGDGAAVLLVHGFADDNSLWGPLIEVLVERRRSLVVLDLPGHGFSEGEWGIAAPAADGILAVAAVLGPIDAVVAHSAGAGGVLMALSEGLMVERAVFIAPPLSGADRWLRHAERLWESEAVARAAQEFYKERIGSKRAAFDFNAVIETLDTDQLYVHSTDDERFPVRDTEEVVARAKRAELLVVEGLSHRRTARDPDVVARIADFVGTCA